ncbi:MAG: hypothetical protein GYB31_19590 [Bacteroidetes bacterium]|nr:hypothetical protein [Bacteroidota bacterium]
MNKILMLFAIALSFAACSSNTSGAGGTEAQTESGFKVVFHEDAEGTAGKTGDFVSFQYEVSNGDTTLFDSREVGNTPQTTIPETSDSRVNTSAVLEALKLASKGDSLSVYYPLDSMASRPQGFEGKEFLIYRLKIEDVLDAETYEAEQREKEEASRAVYLAKKSFLDETLEAYKEGDLDGEIVEHPSGLKMIVHEAGNGEKPEGGQMINANYLGVLMEDGSEFDNSFQKGEAFEFPLGRGGVIQGWDIGFAELSKGAKATFFIPAELGYGERGYPPVIPANADLVFYVELNDFK